MQDALLESLVRIASGYSLSLAENGRHREAVDLGRSFLETIPQNIQSLSSASYQRVATNFCLGQAEVAFEMGELDLGIIFLHRGLDLTVKWLSMINERRVSLISDDVDLSDWEFREPFDKEFALGCMSSLASALLRRKRHRFVFLSALGAFLCGLKQLRSEAAGVNWTIFRFRNALNASNIPITADSQSAIANSFRHVVAASWNNPAYTELLDGYLEEGLQRVVDGYNEWVSDKDDADNLREKKRWTFVRMDLLLTRAGLALVSLHTLYL